MTQRCSHAILFSIMPALACLTWGCVLISGVDTQEDMDAVTPDAGVVDRDLGEVALDMSPRQDMRPSPDMRPPQQDMNPLDMTPRQDMEDAGGVRPLDDFCALTGKTLRVCDERDAGDASCTHTSLYEASVDARDGDTIVLGAGRHVLDRCPVFTQRQLAIIGEVGALIDGSSCGHEILSFRGDCAVAKGFDLTGPTDRAGRLYFEGIQLDRIPRTKVEQVKISNVDAGIYTRNFDGTQHITLRDVEVVNTGRLFSKKETDPSSTDSAIRISDVDTIEMERVLVKNYLGVEKVIALSAQTTSLSCVAVAYKGGSSGFALSARGERPTASISRLFVSKGDLADPDDPAQAAINKRAMLLEPSSDQTAPFAVSIKDSIFFAEYFNASRYADATAHSEDDFLFEDFADNAFVSNYHLPSDNKSKPRLNNSASGGAPFMFIPGWDEPERETLESEAEAEDAVRRFSDARGLPALRELGIGDSVDALEDVFGLDCLP